MFIPNRDAADELLESDEALAFVEKVAKEGAELARAAIPERTGRERDLVVHGGAYIGKDGAESWFGSASGIWHMLEFGSANNPAYAPFRGAVESLGIKYEDRGRT